MSNDIIPFCRTHRIEVVLRGLAPEAVERFKAGRRRVLNVIGQKPNASASLFLTFKVAPILPQDNLTASLITGNLIVLVLSWSTKIRELPPDIRTLPVFLPVFGPAQRIMRKYRVIEMNKNVMVHEIKKVAKEGETWQQTMARIQQEADAKKIPGTAGPPRTTSEAANVQLRVKVRDLENKVVELEDVIVQQKTEIKELKTFVSELLLDKEESKRQIKDLQSDMARVLALFDESAAHKLGNENESLKKDLQAMEDVKDAKEAENISLTARVNTLVGEVRVLNRRVDNLTAALVPVRRRILIDNVRFKIMKAVLGLSILPWDLSWMDFLKDSRITGNQPFNEDLAAARLINYIKVSKTTASPLRPL
ncbi:hypothetical protein D9613_007306 [Agrocybe pediades]|uniref:Uncharacterized protein n=1 Tax=Agrocybe pediades TaxID=84607 RepID=A0A8H4VIQ0_9AGAR|nr:hypothetical protein D9613_007306 [Agrocybe pediades]